MNGNTKESIISNGMEGTYSATAADFRLELFSKLFKRITMPFQEHLHK